MADNFQKAIETLSAEYDCQVAKCEKLTQEVGRLAGEVSRLRAELADTRRARAKEDVGVPPSNNHRGSEAPATRSTRTGGSSVESNLGLRMTVAALADGLGTTDAEMFKHEVNQQSDRPVVLKLPTYRCVINPDLNPFIPIWDGVTMCALLWVALVTPVQVSMLEAKFDALFAFGLVIDFVFIVDMILQFFTMYPAATSIGGARRLERNHRKIILHYVKGWFIVDLLSVIPFDMVNLFLPRDGEVGPVKSIKVVRTLRLLKMTKILKTSRMFHRFEVSAHIPYQRFALAKFLVILLVVCHWQTSIWAMTLSLSDKGDPRWVDGIDDLESHLSVKTSQSGIRTYIASFYFCSYTMTSVGYGDIGAKNLVERVTCIFLILLSGLVWAYILGEVCGIVGDMNAEQQSFRKRMDNLNSMMQERAVPDEMRRRLRSYFLSNKTCSQHLTQKELLSNMSPNLQGEVSLLLNVEWIRKISFLKQFLAEAKEVEQAGEDAEPYRACIADIARNLETMAFAQGENFLQIQTLFILYRGLIGQGSRVVHVGGVWGEDFVLSDMTLLRSLRCCALTYVEVIYIARETFMRVVDGHVFSCPELKDTVRRYVVRLAARRGIVAEAHRRLVERENSSLQHSKTGGKKRWAGARAAETAASFVHSPVTMQTVKPPSGNDVALPFALPNAVTTETETD
eukprot:TRINITY_DN17680_c0_g1_i2.p1 TRINITY_DN17680_c0_g1~~TRINITY_DN17680_c0_g1_i2.p1  ORF type:complete len:682 (-),score=93.02 TRINITY_DN17680_c0_g1_i2:151-2196(-)